MLGCVASCPALYQGMLRYWLMWRLPQMLSLVRGAPGLKFHYCSSRPHDLFNDFPRLFMLSDLLVIGQCGPLLQFEKLQFLHGFDKTWPNVDGTQDALSAIAGKADRPVPDDIAPFLQFFFAPFASTGRVLYAPFSTMLAGPSPDDSSFESAISLLEDALEQSSEDGLPFGFSIKQRMQDAKRTFEQANAPESVPLVPDEQSQATTEVLTTEMVCRQGRYVRPGEIAPLVDSRWQAGDILALEFYLSRYFDTMFLVSGQWAEKVPHTSYNLDLQIPYVKGIPPEALAQAVFNDPEGFKAFRSTISKALAEALKSSGSDEFGKELKRIQADIIDDGVAQLNRMWREQMKHHFFRFGAYTLGAVNVEIGLYSGNSLMEVALKLASTTAASLLLEIGQRLFSERPRLKAQPMYFISKLRSRAKR